MNTKKLLALVLTLAMLVSMLVMPASAAGLTDISTHWAKDSIQRWVDAGVIGGYTDGTFKPNNPITRAEFATILAKALGLSGTTDKAFSDVSGWAKDYIYACAAAGIVSGYTDGTFGPSKNITRQEAMKMYVQAVKLALGEVTDEEIAAFLTEQFTDASDIGGWAKYYAATMVAYGAMEGSNGKLNPKANISRAEVAVILDRLAAVYVSKDGKISTTTKTQADKGYMGFSVIVHTDADAMIKVDDQGNVNITSGDNTANVTITDNTPKLIYNNKSSWLWNDQIEVSDEEIIYYYEHQMTYREERITSYADGTETTTLTTYEYDDNWNVTKKTYTNAEGSTNVYSAEFNENGDVTKVYHNDMLVTEYVYEDDLCVKVVHYTNYTDPETNETTSDVYYTITYAYDDAGNMIESSTVYSYGDTYKNIYKYDEDGVYLGEEHYSGYKMEGSEEVTLFKDREVVLEYDENGLISKETETGYSRFATDYNPETGERVYQEYTSRIHVYEYVDGERSKEYYAYYSYTNRYNEETQKYDYIIYMSEEQTTEYNENGLSTESYTDYNSDNEIVYGWKFVYEYDELGYRTGAKRYNENGVLDGYCVNTYSESDDPSVADESETWYDILEDGTASEQDKYLYYYNDTENGHTSKSERYWQGELEWVDEYKYNYDTNESWNSEYDGDNNRTYYRYSISSQINDKGENYNYNEYQYSSEDPIRKNYSYYHKVLLPENFEYSDWHYNY